MTQTPREINTAVLGFCEAHGAVWDADNPNPICPKCNKELKPEGSMEYYE